MLTMLKAIMLLRRVDPRLLRAAEEARREIITRGRRLGASARDISQALVCAAAAEVSRSEAATDLSLEEIVAVLMGGDAVSLLEAARRRRPYPIDLDAVRPNAFAACARMHAAFVASGVGYPVDRAIAAFLVVLMEAMRRGKAALATFQAARAQLRGGWPRGSCPMYTTEEAARVFIKGGGL